MFNRNERLLCGKTTEPFWAVSMTDVAAAGKAEPRIIAQVERDLNGGQVTVIRFGKYNARFSFTWLEA